MNFLTTAEVAALLGMSKGPVLALIRRGSLRAQRIGVQWVVLPKDLARFVKQRKARFGGRIKMHAGSSGRPPKKRSE
jgi:excisionase family DNA binding protein